MTANARTYSKLISDKM